MSELGVFAYCAAIGFVGAATIANFYQWVTAERAEFVLKPTVYGFVLALLMGMFCGPFIVARRVVAAVKSKEITVMPALLGGLIAGVWSVCAGLFYLSLMMSA